ncbi:MAG TPA: long-chain fatty acid--CoA ligase [Polyangiaceae bacterium]|jgi:long-chain acyl-CoA synthetase
MSTIPRFFLDRVAETPAVRAWTSFEGGAWQDATWADYERRARAFGLGLVAAGMKRGDTVAILGETSAHWAACDVGAIGAGGVTVGLYPTLAPEGVGSMHYVLDHSEARFLAVESTEVLATKIAPILGKLPHLVKVIVWRCDAAARAIDPRVESLEEAAARGDAWHEGHPSAWREACLAAKPDDVALLVYTSGTTGQPKGAMITHRNVDAQTAAVAAVMPWKEDDAGISFLPMAHAAERCIGHYNRIRRGSPTLYARSLATLLEDIEVAKPTIFGSVPRIFEKVYANVRAEIAKLEPGMRAMAEKVLASGVAAGRAKRKGEAVDPETQMLAGIFDQQLGARVRARFGGRCRWLTSGAAPIAIEILELFDACGLPTYELYGMTETAGLLTGNTPEGVRFGTVGRAFPGVELRIADDGEVLARGANVFPGYFKEPAATAECLVDGWLHTGDIGSIDADGFLRITDRKKNILITAGGKNITPSNAEAEVKRDPIVSYCHMHADRRAYPTALVCLDPERLAVFATENSLAGTTAADLHGHEKVLARVQQAVDAANERLARYEQIRRFAIVPREFSVDGGELTPTLKVKRREVDRKYADVIEAMYATEP